MKLSIFFNGIAVKGDAIFVLILGKHEGTRLHDKSAYSTSHAKTNNLSDTIPAANKASTKTQFMKQTHNFVRSEELPFWWVLTGWNSK
jgi:hypothetical protein